LGVEKERGVLRRKPTGQREIDATLRGRFPKKGAEKRGPASG